MIEISDKRAKYVYRQNMFSPRCIDFRRNKHNARWRHYRTYPSTMAAIEALMALSKGETQEPTDAN